MNCNRKSVRWIFDCNKWYPTRQEWSIVSTSIQAEEKERIGRYFFKRDAKNSMVGRLMIRKFLTVNSGSRWKDIEILRGKHGKPYFENKEDIPLNFNISHQGSYAVLAGEVGDVSVGIDIMTVNYKSGDRLQDFLRIMRKQFTTEEYNTVKNCKYNEREICRMFYRIWCLKESYLKAVGSGISENMKDISFNIKDEIVKEDSFITSTEISVRGERLSDWCFEEILIDNDTFVAIALSPKLEPVVEKFQFLDFSDLIKEVEPISSVDEEYCDSFFEKQNFP